MQKPVVVNNLPPGVIKLARQKIKQLSEKMNADRERLIKDEKKTEKYKDDAYYKFVDMIDDM